MFTKMPQESFVRWQNEEYMSSAMQGYFKQRLLAWREELTEKLRHESDIIHENVGGADDIDSAAREVLMQQEIKAMEGDQRLLVEIDRALSRIESGKYGYCEATDAEIGFKRLEAWPIARLCIEVQQRIEYEL